MTLSNLITRLEGMMRPDRNADAMIHHAINDGVGTGCWGDAPHYTSSLDAAMSLVPEGFNWASDPHFDLREFRVYRPYDGITQHHFSATAKTPAIALCIASLRARMSCDATQEAAE